MSAKTIKINASKPQNIAIILHATMDICSILNISRLAYELFELLLRLCWVWWKLKGDKIDGGDLLF